MTPPPPSPGWANESLTAFMDEARQNRFATFDHKKAESLCLVDIDACFQRLAENSSGIAHQKLVPALLLIRSHAAYRAACEHAMAGQFTETFPQTRVCLEYAGYALHIYKNPELGDIFLKRVDGEAEKRR